MEVTLTEIEMEMAAWVGVRRCAESLAEKRKDTNWNKNTQADKWGMDIEAACAEMAYCKARNKFWTGAIGTFKAPDQGNLCQIRHTPLQNGSLIVRKNDMPDYYYVLVIGKAPNYEIIGYIKGSDAKREQYLKAPNDRPSAYFVPQSDLIPFPDSAFDDTA